jgi:hypothetical protein
MTFLSLVHPDLPICYGRCAWRVLYLSTNAILDDNEAPACLSPPFGAKFHDGTQNDTQIDQYCAPLSSRSSYNKNDDINKDDDVFSIGRILKNLHLLLLDHPEGCTTEHSNACEAFESVCRILFFISLTTMVMAKWMYSLMNYANGIDFKQRKDIQSVKQRANLVIAVWTILIRVL